MDPAQLYTIGKKAASDFYQLAVLLQLSQSPTHRHLLVEEQRFKVWAHSLGLYQQGHASLDYRLRDAEVVKSRLADILEELQSHVRNRDYYKFLHCFLLDMGSSLYINLVTCYFDLNYASNNDYS